MKSKILTLCLLLSALLLNGCAYSGLAFPGSYGLAFNKTKMPITANSGRLGSREGSSSASSYLGLITIGDASIDAAARNGNIRDISTVDGEKLNILGLYSKYTTHVTGN